MKVVFHEAYYQVYTSDPASAPGRMEALIQAVEDHVDFVTPRPADEEDIAAVHTEDHIRSVKSRGLYDISALAAGGALMAAEIGLKEPCFAAIRPPGHHASADSSWGFCYFNNMAVALMSLKNRKMIDTAYVLDFDLHYGDGNVNILRDKGFVALFNPDAGDRKSYLDKVRREMETCRADIIGISAGFDNHIKDWGGLLATEDYEEMGRMVREAAKRNDGGCFAIFEGGYNHAVIGKNALALIRGMSGE